MELCDAVWWHHNPDKASNAPMAHLIHLADICSHMMGFGCDLEQVIVRVRMRAEEIELFMQV